LDIDITHVAGSAFLVGLVAGLVTIRTSERKIAMEHITKQRENWRETIRTKSCAVSKAFESESTSELCGLYTEFSHLLNPEDKLDFAILSLIWDFKDKKFESAKHIEFVERIALLLKHDWERAKREAKPWFFAFTKPVRVDYHKAKYKREFRSNLGQPTE